MNLAQSVDEIYEIQLEQLVEGEKENVDAMSDIMNSQMDITVSMGETKATIDKIVNLKIGDVITLDKSLEEALDININGTIIASGESIILDNKLAIRLSKIKNIDGEN
ncbi:FliM/FliN family flagellar motor switch protein [Romboutsia sedimentorum]|uniref:FliM/FliN family flagellar motor switch protein n=1 Tax=Romboutsia sedimentorum TaxID=1368474 RepID=A0ABT7E700_9FIRM|nr:FliM/FliN family flagellar motor switch protein [Romboutsia sedimentorum]MDK2562708.1 FliM/FliN family flagellar motor switch protein [Romboutsia sedimentorum]